MTTGELSQLVSSQGLASIRIEGSADKDDYTGALFIGDLDGFWIACKAVGAKAIFIYASALDEGHFEYELNEDEAIDDGEEEDGLEIEDDNIVDLTALLPALGKFKNKIGTDYAFILCAKGGFSEIAFHIEETWWAKFDEEWSRAVEIAEVNRGAIIEKAEAKRAEREERLVVKLKELISDAEFVSNPTQGGMRAYALEKLPELEELSEETLTEEIRLLSYKIKARGLNRKK